MFSQVFVPDIDILLPDIFCGNKNLPKCPADRKFSGTKLNFDLFHPGKCPMSGAISRLDVETQKLKQWANKL